LGATSLRKSKPEDDNELECVVKWEPVNCVHSRFKNSKESEDDPVCEPLSVIGLADAEESIKGIITRNHKSSKVGQKLSTNVEEDEEEVECDQAEKSVDLRQSGLLLEVVQRIILRKLLINLSNVALSLVLETRHVEDLLRELKL